MGSVEEAVELVDGGVRSGNVRAVARAMECVAIALWIEYLPDCLKVMLISIMHF